jgi:hypothetical protein
VAHHDDGRAVEARKSTDDRGIIAAETIAVERLEVGEEETDVIEGGRTRGVAGELRLLPAGQAPVDFSAKLLRPGFQGSKLGLGAGAPRGAPAERINPRL